MNYDVNYRIAPTIPKISPEEFDNLSKENQLIYLKLFKEQVTPPFEKWRNPARIKCLYSGRGGCGKSESTASLIIQICEYGWYFGNSIKILCIRKVQNSIKDSSKSLFERKIRELGYSDFIITNEYIKNTSTGAEIIFKGLNDYNADNLKSLNDISVCFIEECSSIDSHSWDLLIPSIRKTWIYENKTYTSEIWMVGNLETRNDPFFEKFCKVKHDDWILEEGKPLGYGSPYYPQILIDAYLSMKEVDEEEANHQFLGIPRSNQEHCVWSYEDIENAKDRTLEDESGAIEIGVDVARFGNDFTIAYKRKGLKVIDRLMLHGANTQEVAGQVWELAERDFNTLIKIDLGYNPAVVDLLQEWGANVIGVNFGGKAESPDIYANCASEMMFNLPLKSLSIPSDFVSDRLIEGLAERKFFYNTQGKKQLEPKDSKGEAKGDCFKKRHGYSPDEADAFCLCFYEKRSDTVY